MCRLTVVFVVSASDPSSVKVLEELLLSVPMWRPRALLQEVSHCDRGGR